MAANDAERHLLVGLLALQNGLVDQAQLVAGFQAWTRNKAKPLAEHLIDLGFLDADQREAIETMAALHLKKHGDDPEKSLAALPVGNSTREKLGALDADLDASMARMSDSTEPDADRTSHFSVGAATSEGQRFRVLRPHAKGGLGAVFVALDGELNREVALKQILDEHADHLTSRRRFVVEAEITGGLEHPGIVPVYGLGAQTNGRPYYAMRFIRGDNLKQAIEGFHTVGSAIADQSIPVGSTITAQSERSTKRNTSKMSAIADPTKALLFRNLLRRFTDVCNAIDYAHARGVLHRDIKPGNIIIGKYGETLVVDWGLAKPLGHREIGGDPDERTLVLSSASGTPDTLPGSVLGTPAYMSPEQARGDLDALGAPADVYSLGATLYCLLTGQAPFSGSVEDILRVVQRGAFQRPRERDPAIDPALQAVCLKAMALKPEDRYPTARALADDIDRWLADKPVTAYPEPFKRRAGRWMKRNRTIVAGVVVALVTTLIGLGAVSAVQTKARIDLVAKNAELNSANTWITKSNVDLIAANTALDLQRQRAENREQLAIDAVKRFRDAVTENPELKSNPSLEALRKTLLKEPLAFFKSLRERLQADRDTRPESLDRLASASFELGFLTNEIGDKQDAITAFREALEIQERLARETLTLTQFQSELARSHNALGALLSATGQAEEARGSFERALAILERLASENPRLTQFQSELATIHNNLGVLLHATGQAVEARGSFERALAIWERLASENPTLTQFQSNLAESQNNLGNLLLETGHLDAARGFYERALAIWERLASENPTLTQFQSSLAKSHNNLGVLLRDTGQPAEASGSYERALAMWERLARENPTVTEFQSALAKSHLALGLLLSRAGQPVEARGSYERGLAIQERLARENPTVTQFQSDLATYHYNLGTQLSDNGHIEEARGPYERALAIQGRLARGNPESPDHASRLGGSLNNMAMIDLNANRFAEARVKLMQAIDWQKKALARNSRNPTYRQFLAIHLGNLIKAARGLGREDEADAAQRELAELKASDPQFAGLDARLIAVSKGEAPKDVAERLALAQRAYDTARHALAARLWAEAMAADPKLAASRQPQHRYNAACAAALAGCGQGKDDPAHDDDAKAKLRQQARDRLTEELTAWDGFVANGPPQAKAFLAQTLEHWKQDPDLAGLRDAKALEALPNAERSACRDLWAKVDALLAKAKGKAPLPELPDDPFAR